MLDSLPVAEVNVSSTCSPLLSNGRDDAPGSRPVSLGGGAAACADALDMNTCVLDRPPFRSPPRCRSRPDMLESLIEMASNLSWPMVIIRWVECLQRKKP